MQVRKDFELIGDANIVSIRALSVGNNPFVILLAYFLADKGLDHPMLQRHAPDPVVGFDGHVDSSRCAAIRRAALYHHCSLASACP
jgi:hypothetical protein